MNPSLKQHRHPGLWSLPQSESKPLAKAIANQPISAEQASWQELSTLRDMLVQAAMMNEQENGWITLIGQPSDVSVMSVREAIGQVGIDAKRVRWIRPSDNESKTWAAEQACLLDNSAVIVAWLDECQHRDALRLQLARKHTRAQVLLFHSFSHTTPLH